MIGTASVREWLEVAAGPGSWDQIVNVAADLCDEVDRLAARLAEVEQALRTAERRVKVREDQVGIWKTLLYRRIGTLEEQLHHLAAVAGNVVLVDDDADLLVPDWRAVVEALREAIDPLRAVLDKRTKPAAPTKVGRHMEHYRSCGCLDDSDVCCDPSCCTVLNKGEPGAVCENCSKRGRDHSPMAECWPEQSRVTPR